MRAPDVCISMRVNTARLLYCRCPPSLSLPRGLHRRRGIAGSTLLETQETPELQLLDAVEAQVCIGGSDLAIHGKSNDGS